ncbi:MAG: hypothetical protein H6641_12380 [Caldilineaceae bacterium]|nr:hypothetical protein [Caldilineaceae bacterium]
MPNLDFEGQNTLYATHGLHAFAAKCPPQLVRYGLRYYSKYGDVVVDPMMGSGTTIVESKLMGRNAIGYDLDPLSTLLAGVKSTEIQDEALASAAEQIIASARIDFELWCSYPDTPKLASRATPPDFRNRDYWFLPEVAAALSLLSYYISEADTTENVRHFCWIAFSSLILAKNSVANARDIVHSRHHHKHHDQAPDVITKFSQRITRMRKQMAEYRQLSKKHETIKTKVEKADARKLPLDDEQADLVFTSPPYVTALDYPRAHFLAIPWMYDVLGLELSDYIKQAPIYIGSERGSQPRTLEIDPELSKHSLSMDTLDKLTVKSTRHAKLLYRYMVDMHSSLNEMSRVLRTHKHIIIVVCPSHMRKVDVPTHDILVELGRDAGLKLKQKHTRTISKRKRILPYMKEAFGQRMSTEYVLVFQKR